MDVLKTKKIIIRLFFALIVTTLLGAILSGGNWLIYYRPAYEARVVDFDTGEPIKDAVIVAIYHDRTYGFVQALTGVSEVREVLTNRDGVFEIPSMISLLFPFSKADGVSFIVFKSGYRSIDYYSLDELFSIGMERLILKPYRKEYGYAAISNGAFEIQKVEGGKARLRNIPSYPIIGDIKKMPLLHEAISEERLELGFGEELK